MSEDLFGSGDNNSGTVFRDTIMLALAGFVSLVVLLLPFINPPAETDLKTYPVKVEGDTIYVGFKKQA